MNNSYVGIPHIDKEIEKIICYYVSKYEIKSHPFFNKSDLRGECLLKLAEYLDKGKLGRETFLKSYATAVCHHFNSLHRRFFKRQCRKVECPVTSVMGMGNDMDYEDFIDLKQEYQAVEDTFDIIVFNEQLEELNRMLTPFSSLVLEQLLNPAPGLSHIMNLQLQRKKHVRKESSTRPKLHKALEEYYRVPRSKIKLALEEIKSCLYQLSSDWQVAFNDALEWSAS